MVAPEPVETIWQSLRQNRLANRVFDSDDVIVDVCCDAWNALIAVPVAGAGPRGPPLSQVLTVWLSITAAVGASLAPAPLAVEHHQVLETACTEPHPVRQFPYEPCSPPDRSPR